MQSIENYFSAMSGKRIAVVGLGISNRPVVRMFLERGFHVSCYDRTEREKLLPEVLELEKQGAELHLGTDYLDKISGDVIFRTPGLNANTPQLRELVRNGAVMTSEMEAFFSVCPCKIIGITGSDGKTTTTTLTAKLLEGAGKTVWCGGNIGTPLFPLAEKMKPEDYAVVELSSFQLMSMNVSPSVALITNITPNHLDIHKDMEEYVDAKKQVFLHQGPNSRLVLNAEDRVSSVFSELCTGELLEFSSRKPVNRGYYLRQDQMICRISDGKETEILSADEILVPGMHNVENYMAAFCATDGIVQKETMIELAHTFGGVAHRIQLCRVWRGIRFYDSSIDSSPNRTKAALRSFKEKVILVAGGKDKGIEYDDLGPELRDHVKIMVLTGMTSEKIRKAAESAPGYDGSNPKIIEIEGFDDAVRTAAGLAGTGDVVLLSPASTSFDRFRNFEERGNRFQSVVAALED